MPWAKVNVVGGYYGKGDLSRPLYVGVHNSHSLYTLPRDDPHFSGKVAVLEESRKQNAPIRICEAGKGGLLGSVKLMKLVK